MKIYTIILMLILLLFCYIFRTDMSIKIRQGVTNFRILFLSLILATFMISCETKETKQNYEIYQKFPNNGPHPQNHQQQFKGEQTFNVDHQIEQVEEEEESDQEKEKRRREYNIQFNFYLYYGLIIGTALLLITLLRQTKNRNVVNRRLQNNQVYRSQGIPQVLHNAHSIDEAISFHSREVQKLRQLKLRMKFDQEQKKNQQERNAFTRRQEMRQYKARLRTQQHFVPQDVNQNQLHHPLRNGYQVHPYSMNYNNDIPFGTPIDPIPLKRDNDSSFASSYPEI